MDRIVDPRLHEIFETRACPGLPADVSRTAYRLVRLLLAARGWSDVDVFTRVAKLPDGKFAVPVAGKWVITFSW